MTGDELEVEGEISRQLDALGGELQAASRMLRNAPYSVVEQMIFDSQIKLGHIESAASLMRLGNHQQALAMLSLREVPQVELFDDEADALGSAEEYAGF